MKNITIQYDITDERLTGIKIIENNTDLASDFVTLQRLPLTALHATATNPESAAVNQLLKEVNFTTEHEPK
jgi:hypothetical protein